MPPAYGDWDFRGDIIVPTEPSPHYHQGLTIGETFGRGGNVGQGQVVPTVTPRPTAIPNAQSFFNKGYEYGEAGNWEMSIAEYTKAIQVDPDYAFAYNNRGIAYRNLGQSTLASADRTKACQLDTQSC